MGRWLLIWSRKQYATCLLFSISTAIILIHKREKIIILGFVALVMGNGDITTDTEKKKKKTWGTDVWEKLISTNILPVPTSPALSSFAMQQVLYGGNSAMSLLFFKSFHGSHVTYNTIKVSLQGHALFDQFVLIHFLQSLAHNGGVKLLSIPQIFQALSNFRNLANVASSASLC